MKISAISQPSHPSPALGSKGAWALLPVLGVEPQAERHSFGEHEHGQ